MADLGVGQYVMADDSLESAFENQSSKDIWKVDILFDAKNADVENPKFLMLTPVKAGGSLPILRRRPEDCTRPYVIYLDIHHQKGTPPELVEVELPAMELANGKIRNDTPTLYPLKPRQEKTTVKELLKND